MDLQQLVAYCDTLLRSREFEDYCPNGLQVEAGAEVRRLVTGVSASQALIDAAVNARADALLTHHGFFWKGEAPCLVGMKGRRVAALMRHGVSLLAYHLPLDAHPGLGNNARLGDILGVLDARPVDSAGSLLWRGELAEAVSLETFSGRVDKALQRAPIAIAGSDRPVRRIAWCSGAAQGYIEQAASLGVDLYLSGEISEQTTHLSRELGIHYVAAGHHATERYGAQALGAHLAQELAIEHMHIDIDNPA
jgi:dinuclear metal center YbgI/SA1388 family protein